MKQSTLVKLSNEPRGLHIPKYKEKQHMNRNFVTEKLHNHKTWDHRGHRTTEIRHWPFFLYSAIYKSAYSGVQESIRSKSMQNTHKICESAQNRHET